MLLKVQKEAEELGRINLEEEHYRLWDSSASNESVKEEIKISMNKNAKMKMIMNSH